MSSASSTPKTVWITGAGKGIGRALALRLTRDGHRIAVSARGTADLADLQSEAASFSGQIHPFPLDVTHQEDVRNTIGRIETDLGPIDLAILNAGTFLPFGARDFSAETFRQQVEVNLMGTVHGLEVLLPAMMARRHGQVAVMGSVSGYCGLPNAAAYGATKAALINLCESLAPECREAGVRLSVINPGFVKTPLTDRNAFPMPFIISAEEAADTIVRGLERGTFEIAFPRRMVWLMRVLRALPYPLFFSVTRRIVS